MVHLFSALTGLFKARHSPDSNFKSLNTRRHSLALVSFLSVLFFPLPSLSPITFCIPLSFILPLSTPALVILLLFLLSSSSSTLLSSGPLSGPSFSVFRCK